MVEKKGRMRYSPYAIAIFRILVTPLLCFTFILDSTEIAVTLYIVAFASDVLDGRLAKRYKSNTSSPLKSYLDPIADFVLIFASFYTFSLKQIYPDWILIVFVLMFLFFIFSSRRRKPIYDPVGKYYGTFLMVTIGITLVFPLVLIFNAVLVSIIIYTLGLVVFRTAFLLKNRFKNEDLNSHDVRPE